MTTVATLTPRDLRVAPGTETRCTVTIHNRGEIVEGYHLEVLGDIAQWATVTPPQVQVYPGTEATAEVLIRLPRGAKIYATSLPFAVRVLPMERPDHVVVPEGTLHVGELAALGGEMLPQTSRTRRATVHDVAIDNLGNAPTVVELTVTDPDNALKIAPRPARMAIGPGRAAVARVDVRHRRLLWRGQPIARRFQVTAATADGPGVALDGTSVQQPVIGKWLIPAAAALLALLMLGAGLWFALLKPAVKSEASKAGQAAAAKEVANQNSEVDKKEGPPEGGANPSASGPGGASGGPNPNASGGNGGKPTAPSSLSLQYTAIDNEGGTILEKELRPRSANRFTISFFSISAPQGDTGFISIYVGTSNNNPLHIDNLFNVRYYDTHPNPAVEVPPNTPVRLRLNCQAAGPMKVSPNSTSCYANVVISGTEYKPAP